MRDLGIYRVRELPDGSWEWIYFGRSHRGDSFLFSDRFGYDMYAYFMGEEWNVELRAERGSVEHARRVFQDAAMEFS